MNLFSVGLVLDTIGKVLIGLAVLTVHHRISKERGIDKDVLRVMRKEFALTTSGIFLIILGAILQLISR